MTNRADMEALAALCLAAGLDMHEAGETELARINVPETVAKIRAKQAAKPTGSALPTAAPAVPQDVAGISDRLKRIQRDMLETVSGSTGWIDGSEARAFVQRIEAELQQLAALSQHPSPVAVGEDDVARSLLAAAHDEHGFEYRAALIRAAGDLQMGERVALAAIRAALARAGQGYGRGVRVDVIDDLKARCNRYALGHCNTRACHVRGGWTGGPTDPETATCADHEILLALAAPLQNGEG